MEDKENEISNYEGKQCLKLNSQHRELNPFSDTRKTDSRNSLVYCCNEDNIAKFGIDVDATSDCSVLSTCDDSELFGYGLGDANGYTINGVSEDSLNLHRDLSKWEIKPLGIAGIFESKELDAYIISNSGEGSLKIDYLSTVCQNSYSVCENDSLLSIGALRFDDLQPPWKKYLRSRHVKDYECYPKSCTSVENSLRERIVWSETEPCDADVDVCDNDKMTRPRKLNDPLRRDLMVECLSNYAIKAESSSELGTSHALKDLSEQRISVLVGDGIPSDVIMQHTLGIESKINENDTNTTLLPQTIRGRGNKTLSRGTKARKRGRPKKVLEDMRNTENTSQTNFSNAQPVNYRDTSKNYDHKATVSLESISERLLMVNNNKEQLRNPEKRLFTTDEPLFNAVEASENKPAGFCDQPNILNKIHRESFLDVCDNLHTDLGLGNDTEFLNNASCTLHGNANTSTTQRAPRKCKRSVSSKMRPNALKRKILNLGGDTKSKKRKRLDDILPAARVLRLFTGKALHPGIRYWKIHGALLTMSRANASLGFENALLKYETRNVLAFDELPVISKRQAEAATQALVAT